MIVKRKNCILIEKEVLFSLLSRFIENTFIVIMTIKYYFYKKLSPVNLTVLCIIMLISGCSSHKIISTEDTNPIKPVKNSNIRLEVDKKLIKTSANIRLAIDKLVRLKQSKTLPSTSPLENKIIKGKFAKLISITWNGPGNKILKKISNQFGVELNISGPSPIAPIIVNISDEETSLIKIIEKIGLQMAPYATVVVDIDNNNIELRYDAI